MKLCIIGAGTAGLCAGRWAIHNNFTTIIYEQSGAVGGTWIYTDDVGINEFGLDVHTSMYQNLRTNLPKEIMGFPDLDITSSEVSYISSTEIKAYLNEYADKFGVKGIIQFYHHVVRVQPRGGKWQVIVHNLLNSRITVDYFDFIMVCSGHYHTPFYPIMPGSDQFKGTKMHSHDYRSPKMFKDETVLVVGAGPSGIDLYHAISRVAKRVTLSHHMSGKSGSKLEGIPNQKPIIKALEKNGARFCDGSYESYSIVFYCTGYQYAFPFLTTECGIFTDDNYIQFLFKHCININNPTMALIGIPFYICASQMMDIQVRFVMKYFLEKKFLPSPTHMLRDECKEMTSRLKCGYKKRQAHMMGSKQNDYFLDLAETADISKIKPVMASLHEESSRRFDEEWKIFRNDVFKLIDSSTFIKFN